MIKPHCFTKEWIDSFKKQKHFKRINPPVLEKMIQALSLLQYLKSHELSFTFKGGTCLVILLSTPRRFSIDIDILTNEGREKIEGILDKIIENSHFTKWKLQENRSYKSGVPKAHYEIHYQPSTVSSGGDYVLLDILYENSEYPVIQQSPIQCSWIENETEIHADTPSIESILGDKLTAFAPNSTGILYGKNKSAEIVKQLFDIACLFDDAEDIEAVAKSFKVIVEKEINYRGLDISASDVLNDIFNTALLITKRDKNTGGQDKSNFKEITKGLKSFEGYLFGENFKIEEAITASSKAAYLAQKLLAEDYAVVERFNGQDLKEMLIDGDYNHLNKLKKVKDKSGFFYWYKALEYLN